MNLSPLIDSLKDWLKIDTIFRVLTLVNGKRHHLRPFTNQRGGSNGLISRYCSEEESYRPLKMDISVDGTAGTLSGSGSIRSFRLLARDHLGRS